MTTPSGNITIGNVGAEIGVPDPLTLGDGRVRQLAGVPGGPITLGQCRNKTGAASAPPPPPPPSYPPYGQRLSTYCNGYMLVGVYANGAGGTYEQAIDARSPTCGWNPPPAGTIRRTYCVGQALYADVEDGNYGIYQTVLESNSTQCGFVPPPAAGTVLGQTCEMYSYTGDSGGAAWSLMDIVADGKGGAFESLHTYNYGPCYPVGPGQDPGGGSGG